MNRINWIDIGKGICILLVILFHTETNYYHCSDLTFWYHPFFMTFFFFVSGYLFNLQPISIKKKLKYLFNKLLWPYLIFSFLIMIPKAYVFDLQLIDLMIGIFRGESFWFITALIVAEFLLSFILFYISNTFLLILIGLIAYLSSLSDLVQTIFPWPIFWGIQAVFYMIIGHLSYRFKDVIDPVIKHKVFLITSTTLYFVAVIPYYIEYRQVNEMASLCDKSALYFIIQSILGIAMMLGILSHIMKANLLSNIGRNTLIMYFLNGGIIQILSIFFTKYFGLHWEFFFLIFIMSSCFCYGMSNLIKRRCEYMIDFSKIRNLLSTINFRKLY